MSVVFVSVLTEVCVLFVYGVDVVDYFGLRCRVYYPCFLVVHLFLYLYVFLRALECYFGLVVEF